MKYVLIACECSQIVCTAFRACGCLAFSCDLQPSYGGHPEWHIVQDASIVVRGGIFKTEIGNSIFVSAWDLMVAHPPCTMLTHSSAVALSQGKHTLEDVRQGAEFFMKMFNAPIPRIAIENPAPMKIANLPRYNQIIQPYQFGHRFSKRICLWLKNLPQIIPMQAEELNHKPWLEHCSGRPKRRSHFWSGVAEAMAAQWSPLI